MSTSTQILPDVPPTKYAPSVGRIVWVFHRSTNDPAVIQGPAAGIVIKVVEPEEAINERTGEPLPPSHPRVVVQIFNYAGEVAWSAAEKMALFDPLPPEAKHTLDRWAEWMPYQKQKHDEGQKKS